MIWKAQGRVIALNVQEIFAQILLGLTFTLACHAALYIGTLIRFLKELRQREPDVWRKIGSPTLLNMLFLPFIRFRKFYAFMPVLKARRHQAEYRHAKNAWRLLRFGLMFCVLLLVNVVLLAFSVAT